MNLKNKSNQYVDGILNDIYDGIPKSVFAAIAFSLAMRIREDNFDLAKQELLDEWKILFENGIIPQCPGNRNS